ncbi:MAG: YicC/YloC family endoribonuclease [Bacteroidota bacterium]
MVASMTGYGAATHSSSNYNITVELKSLNSKYFEALLKLPRTYLQYEHKLRSELGSKLTRGKVTFFLNVEVLNPEKRSLNINTVLAKAYFEELSQLREDLNITEPVKLDFLINLPEVLPVETGEADPEEWELIQAATHEACKKLILSREVEGKALETDLKGRVSSIQESLSGIEGLAGDRIQHIRTRLDNSIQELRERVDADHNRFEQELVFYMEKLDINEEIVRLTQHLTYFLQILAEPVSNGKKLNFISQEMGREINTIGSKAQYAPIQRFVVSMKDELDKIKEQVLNIV